MSTKSQMYFTEVLATWLVVSAPGVTVAGSGAAPRFRAEANSQATPRLMGQNFNPIRTFDGQIVAWGNNANGQCTPPLPNEGFSMIAGGSGHSAGLKLDGSIVVWGRNDYGQCNVPSPNSDFVAVASGGGDHNLGLKSDGSLVVWGRNDYGQLNVPPPNADFAAIAAGYSHSLALKTDGSVSAWGANGDGQSNVPAPNTGFVAVAGGGFHSLGLTANGSIVAWGSNLYGQCDVPPPNSGFVAVAGGTYHSLGLKIDGSIVAWGRADYGQCSVPTPNADFVAVAGGWLHSLGLKADGSIVAWGNNSYGECNVPAPNADFVAIASLSNHSLGLRVAPSTTEHLYVASEHIPGLYQFDPTDGQFLATYNCPGWHEGGAGRYLTFDNQGYAWVTDNTPSTITKLGPRGRCIASYPVTAPHNLLDVEYCRWNDRLYVIARTGGSGTQQKLIEMDLNGTQTERLTWGTEFEANCIGFGPDGLIYITRYALGSEIGRVYDSDFNLVRTILPPPGGGIGWGIAFAGDKFYITVGGGAPSAIHEYQLPDASHVRAVASFDPPGISGLTRASETSLWVMWGGISAAAEVDIATGQVLQLCSGVPGADLELGPPWQLLADLNCDYVIDFDDINPFVLAIQSHAQYVQQYPDCEWLNADCTGDGYVDFDDINCLVALLSR